MKRAEFEENSISEQQKIKMSLSCLSTLKSLCCSVWAEEWSVCAQTVTPAAEIIRESVKYPSLTLTTIMLWTHFKYVTINQEGHHSYLFFGNCDSKEMVISRYGWNIKVLHACQSTIIDNFIIEVHAIFFNTIICTLRLAVRSKQFL